jgi:hypothetical protein
VSKPKVDRKKGLKKTTNYVPEALTSCDKKHIKKGKGRET